MNENIRFDPNKVLKRGGTKNVYQGAGGTLVLEFTDRVRGKDGPGEEEGAGATAYATAVRYFRLMQERGLPTHFLDACDERRLILVRSARLFGNGLEWVYRGVASGSFVRRYGMYVKEGAPLPPYVETRFKDAERGDPFVTPQALQALGLMHQQAYDACMQLCSAVFALLSSDLLSHGLALWAAKLEVGLDAEGRIMVIDAVSPDCLRVRHGNNTLSASELASFLGC